MTDEWWEIKRYEVCTNPIMTPKCYPVINTSETGMECAAHHTEWKEVYRAERPDQ